MATLGSLGASAPAAQALNPIPPFAQEAIDSPTPQATSFQGFGLALMKAQDVDRDGVGDVITATSDQNVGTLTGVGRAWVFSGRSRKVLLTLEHPEPQADAAFGRSVIGVGDVNGDGYPDLEAGASRQDVYVGPGTACGTPEPNGCNENQGKAYVFSGKDGTLLYPIDDPVRQSNAQFGFFYVAAPGDLNGDGRPDLVLAARNEDVNGVLDTGAAYAFSGKDGKLLYRIDNPDSQTSAGFGRGIGDPGDVDGDGVGDIVIGASGETVNGLAGQGRAYLFSGKTGQRLLTLNDPEPQAGASFGATLGGRGAPGDVNGDGVRDIYVNATGQSIGGLQAAGRGYIFSGKDGSLIRPLDDPTPEVDGGFGFAYDDAGDLNGDGTHDLLVGQFSSGNPTKYRSGAWVFDGRSGDVLVPFEGTFDGPGDTLASPGDVNGDKCPDYFIGGPSLDVGSTANQGRIIVKLSRASPPGCGPRASAGAPGPGPTTVAAFAGCPLLTANVIRGSAVSEVITGTSRGDRIFAGAGDDSADGLAGDDCIDLGPGRDRGQGGPGADLVLGGLGSDLLLGSAGGDRLFGGSGIDRILGASGRDRISGGSGNDRLGGGSGGDRISGSGGRDRLLGGSGADALFGGSGSDRISGGSGRDRISAGSGRDRIDARDRRRDRISCGSGRDRVVADANDRVSRNCERVRRVR